MDYRAAGLAATLAAALLGGARPAAADPVFGPPLIGRARWGGGPEDAALVGLTAEARALGVAGVRRLSSWPDRQLGIEAAEPQLVAGRIGLIAHLRCVPLTLVAQVDLSEPMRPDRPDDLEPGALAGAIVDDLYVMWRAARPAQLALGRARVPWSKLRQYDEIALPLGGVPFLVDRVAPDRRWGLALAGDLGALAYAAGAWEDLDALEPRLLAGDPSAGGALAVAAHLEWTPVAPMMGSNPPGRVAGARGPAPTPRADPWFGTARVSLGLGGLWRLREDGSTRVDAAFSAQVKYRWMAALAEVIGSFDGNDAEAGAWAELIGTPIDRLAITARGEWDGGAGADGVWGVGGGLTWYATRDRRNKVAFVGWFRRDVARDTAYDAAVVLLQAAL